MKAVLLGSVGLGLFYVLVDPEGAACVTQSLLGMLADGATGLLEFTKQFFAPL